MSYQRQCVLVVLGLSTIAALETLPANPSSLTAAQETSAKIWIGRYQEIEEYLRTGSASTWKSSAPRPSKAFRCVFRPGGPVARMAWRPIPRESTAVSSRATRPGSPRIEPRQASEDGHGATHGGTAAARQHRCCPAMGGERSAWKGDAPPGEANRPEWDKQLARMKMFAASLATGTETSQACYAMGRGT